MMRCKIRRILLGFIYLGSLQAAPLPILKVAADAFSPPFVMRGANNQLYGFDIDMMENICQILKRQCVYQPMSFINLLPSVESQLADVAVGGITITLDRSKVVSFSIPYLLSYAQYIGLKSTLPPSFSLNDLAGKKIGIEAGTVFKETLNELSVKNITVVEIKNHASIILALENRKIDYALMDASAVQYWQGQSKDKMVAVGTPFLYGYGFGIAVNESNPGLLEDINTALLEYQNNGGFQKAYNQYIAHF